MQDPPPSRVHEGLAGSGSGASQWEVRFAWVLAFLAQLGKWRTIFGDLKCPFVIVPSDCSREVWETTRPTLGSLRSLDVGDGEGQTLGDRY